jgi:signal transduction histidine kinase/ligand-binding sensor domain-containing protein
VTERVARYGRLAIWAAAAYLLQAAWALDPSKSLTQYSRRTWAQEDLLPQDTIKAIAQTTDGYLWLGTDEGLARFDGFEFTPFNKSNGDLPANSIAALAASQDGSLWIGTSSGLTQYHGKQFRSYSVKDGLPDNDIRGLYSDHAGTLWIVAGIDLCRYQDGKFVTYKPGPDLPVDSVRVVREDPQHQLLGGYKGVVRFSGGKSTVLIDAAQLGQDIVTALLVDRQGNTWVGGSLGLIRKSPRGEIKWFDTHNGLPDDYVRSILEDRDGNLWVGTSGGIARLNGERFEVPTVGQEGNLVRALLEDREGDLWVGGTNGLTRLRDDSFTSYGKSEGLPSDQPNAVFQDRLGRIWVGFQDAGLMLFSGAPRHVFTPREGMPETEVLSIRESPGGDLLIGTRAGLVRMHGSTFSTYKPPDPFSRMLYVFDVLEEADGKLWLATSGGLMEKTGTATRMISGASVAVVNAATSLWRGRDGVIWAGTNGKGLWRIQGDSERLLGLGDGLSSENIRKIYEDADGTVWVGTLGGGLDAIHDGKVSIFTQKDGLLSDNVVGISDDGESLWLSTTRGVCRISKKQLWDLAAGKRKQLQPVNYGVQEGLRSAQCTPGYPTEGGTRTADGRLWFTTSGGLAVYDPHARRPQSMPPIAQILQMTADGREVDLSHPEKLPPDVELVQFHYTAIHLSAPEQVIFAYRLGGLESRWTPGPRRESSYNPKHGHYTFTVKASLPDNQSTETSYSFEVLPHYYETNWFRALCVAGLMAFGWAIYQLRLRQIRSRFSLVLEERARLAREIHDTLAQGFVGISSQLDAVAMCMPEEQSPARKYLDMARRMARHSLTEARRSVMDLRASVLEGQDLAAALESGMRMWTAGAAVEVKVEVSGPETVLPQEMEQHLLRIAQEAVTNVVKHAGAKSIGIKLHMEARKLYLRIKDNGRGFETPDVFSSRGGHFGLIGMRERAERLGGELRLSSQPGEGTEVEVTVPLP